MLTAAKFVGLLLLFLSVYLAINRLLAGAAVRQFALGRSNGAHVRMSGRNRKMATHMLNSLVRHLAELLQSARVGLNANQLLMLSCVLGASGAAAGQLYFASLKGVVVLGVLLLLAPYIWLRSRLVTIQIGHRIDFLPAVECFYQIYVLSETKNVRTVLGAVLDGDRLPPSIKPVFERLYRSLMVRRDTDDSLRSFAFALGSRWSDHLSAMLRFGIEDGADLSAGLRELIGDMRRAIRSDQSNRNRLLEIRIANFSPLLFLVMFLFINYRIDAQQAYQYYVVSEAGRDMLLDALLLIGASFGMGLYLSMRKAG